MGIGLNISGDDIDEVNNVIPEQQQQQQQLQQQHLDNLKKVNGK